MSYSFNVRGASRAVAVAAAMAELDKVVVQQPAHAHDRDAAMATITAFAALVPEPEEGNALSLNVSGYVSYSTGANGEPTTYSGAHVSVSAAIVRNPLG
jgi:hypothetical protein